MSEPNSTSESDAESDADLAESFALLRPYLGLLSLLAIATFFEGFDTKLVGLLQPVIATTFEVTTEQMGTAVGISSIGMMLAFFVIHLADRVGRRPIFLGALFAYSILTLATAFAPNLAIYTGLQLLARMAMVVELNLAYVILSESLPARVRGRANGMLGAIANLGAAPPAGLLAPLESIGVGWRGLFLIGALPLLLFPLYWRKLRETTAFSSRATESSEPRAEWRLFTRLASPEHRMRLVGITTLWLTINFWTGSTVYFLFVYASRERGWDAADLVWLPLGTIPIGLLGYLAAGWSMDRFGRRPTACAYLAGAFLVTLWTYLQTSHLAIYFGWCALIGLGGLWTIASTWTAELFPTELRATALGTTNNLLGRAGLVIGPMITGFLITELGSASLAVCGLATITLACIPVILMTLPETRSLELTSSAERNQPGI